jgi:hypothetical protein
MLKLNRIDPCAIINGYTNSKSKRYFCWQRSPAYAWVVVGFLNVCVIRLVALPRRLNIIFDLKMLLDTFSHIFHSKKGIVLCKLFELPYKKYVLTDDILTSQLRNYIITLRL